MKYYLAYGSNMNTEQMAFRCPTAKVYAHGMLEGYELFFAGRVNCAVASIRKNPNKSIPVLIWTIGKEDEESLDRYEGYPRFYTKVNIPFTVNGKTIQTMAYVMTKRPASILGTPSRSYFNTIASGYEEFGFDLDPLYEGIKPDDEKLTMLSRLARQQLEGSYTVCPRCGKPIKERVITNALSRRADIYVCDRCGMMEAMADFFDEDDSINDWFCFKSP